MRWGKHQEELLVAAKYKRTGDRSISRRIVEDATAWRKICPSVTVSTTDPMWTCLRSKQVLSNETPLANRLNCQITPIWLN
jgi:hypothetical protein